MENARDTQPDPMQEDQASSEATSSDEQGQQAYDYQGQTKSVVRSRAVIRGAPRKFELNERVKMQVEDYVQGHGKIVSILLFTVHSYLENAEVGWTYQLLDNNNVVYRGGYYFEEACLSKERRRR